MLFEDRVMMHFLWCPLFIDRFPSISRSHSRGNKSSHDGYQGNLSYPSLFPMGSKKCNRARIMIRPLQRCQGSFLSIADFCRSLFQCLKCSSGRPSDVFLLYLLCMCDHPCQADSCHYGGPGVGHEKLNGLVISGVYP
jgi:hypothetical protein